MANALEQFFLKKFLYFLTSIFWSETKPKKKNTKNKNKNKKTLSHVKGVHKKNSDIYHIKCKPLNNLDIQFQKNVKQREISLIYK